MSIYSYKGMTTLSKDTLDRAVSVSKILGSETRVKILGILMHSDTDVCVKDVAEAIGLSHSATSHQLAKLQAQGVVSPCRKGQTMCYCLTDSRLSKDITRVIKHLA